MKGLKKSSTEPPWLSISDMMTVLMIFFLLCYMFYVKINSQYTVRSDIKILLEKMMSGGQMSHNSEVDDSATMHLFDLNFENDRYELTPITVRVIKDSFPLFIKGIESYSNRIEKIRIEGHTSRSGSYVHNLELSQNRSREVLVFILTNLGYSPRDWFYDKLTASGRSYSDLIMTNHRNELIYRSRSSNRDGFQEDITRSRRVTYGFDLTSPQAEKVLKEIRSK